MDELREVMSPENFTQNQWGLLINVSNHPSTKWGEEQKSWAREIIDIPFPQVPANAGEDLIPIAENLAFQIKEIANRDAMGKVVVHIMGEQGLCFALVNMCHLDDITCVHSVTERVTEENPETGEKTSRFQFNGFRFYVRFV